MAEEDNLDIDIYGEDTNENTDYKEGDGGDEYSYEDQSQLANGDTVFTPISESEQLKPPTTALEPANTNLTQSPHKPQGTKRKEGSVERTIEAGSTQALMISELHWWTTEDDIRAWINAAECEDELKDITFSEHKVNGKSKGQAFVDFESAAAASTVKYLIEGLAEEKPARKFAVNYANHMNNPFKTNPKDAPARKEESRRGAYNSGPPHQPTYQTNGFRGRGGGNFNNRGGGGYNAGNYNNNRNFSGGMNGGYNNGMPAGGFQGAMPGGMMNGFNGGFNRGGGMAMRGGRGAMNTGMGMPMGGMGMGMGMGMNPMMGGMNMGFQPNQNMFNPAMFNQGQAAWNQQGGPNKRQRQE
jgi:hypothetical protein